MQRPLRNLLLALFMGVLAASRAAAYAEPPSVKVESSLATSGKQIRQFAFDGDKDSYFASEGHPGAADHFTLTLERPVPVRSIEVLTGRPGGGGELQSASLEVSSDGRVFEPVAIFAKGGVAG